MNSKKSETLSCIQAALNALDQEIKKPDVDRITEIKTLSDFQKLLKKMHEDVELERLASPCERRSGMGRVIADSWPSASVLGEFVIKAENAFLNLRL